MPNDQIQEFHNQIVELVKKYQFRDRNQVTCCGISVSQCYILETLHTHGDLTMNRLAEKMHLKISTVTRVVEQLILKGYVRRDEDPNDRRFRLISLTDSGEKVFQTAWKNIYQSEKTILENFPEAHRDMLVQLLKMLNKAVEEWRSCCSRT